MQLNQRRVYYTMYAFLARWSRGMVITLRRAFLLSPTMNLDGKRGFSGEENVSGSKEPAEARLDAERERAIERVGNNNIHSQTGQLDKEAARLGLSRTAAEKRT